jgi:integrase
MGEMLKRESRISGKEPISHEKAVLWTFREAASHLAMTEKALRHLHQRGQGPRTVRIGRRLYIRPEAAETWVGEKTAAEGTAPVKITTRPAPHDKTRTQVDITFPIKNPKKPTENLRVQKTAPKGLSAEQAEQWGRTKAEEILRAMFARAGKENEENIINTPKSAKTSAKVFTLEEVFARCEADSILKLESATRDSWQEIWRNHLAPRFGNTPIDIIDRQVLADFVDSLKKKGLKDKGLGAKRINSIVGKLKRLLNFASEKGWLKETPKLKKEKEIDAFEKTAHDDNEIEALHGVARGRAMVAVALGLECGLRRGEILALRWGDVDFAKDEVTVRHSMYRRKLKPPKGKKVVAMPMTPVLRTALELAHKADHGPTDHVVPGPDGRRDMAPQTLYELVRDAYKEAKVPFCGLHKMRHTFVSRLYENGNDLIELQLLARHASARETQRYMHLRGDKDRSAAAIRARGLAKLVNRPLKLVEAA